MVVVGAYREDSAATGVDGDGLDDSAPSAGAAYLYERIGGTWNPRAYLKSSNAGVSDEFGWAVAVSGDLVVVGAHEEDSAATGVNGDPGNSSAASSSGAAYVFDLDGPGPWVDVGGGTAGVPRLTLSGPLTPASALSLELLDAPPSTVCCCGSRPPRRRPRSWAASCTPSRSPRRSSRSRAPWGASK